MAEQLEELELLLERNEKIQHIYSQHKQGKLIDIIRMGAVGRNLIKLQAADQTLITMLLGNAFEKRFAPADSEEDDELKTEMQHSYPQKQPDELLHLLVQELARSDKKAFAIEELPAMPPQQEGKRPRREWTRDEHARFVLALESCSYRDFKLISLLVGTRTRQQVKAHMQKYIMQARRQSSIGQGQPDATAERDSDA